MKNRFFLSVATALLGVASLFALSINARASGETSAQSVRLRVDVDRAVLPEKSTEKAVVKIALAGVRRRVATCVHL